MKPLTLVMMSLTLAVAHVAAQPPAAIAIKRNDGELVITAGDAAVATYVYQDARIPRPYFAHVHAPGKVQVTRSHPPVAGKDATDHAELHPGLWLAFGDLSGADSWRLKARVQHEKFIEEPANGRFAVLNRYLAADGKTTICRETCRYIVRALPGAYLLTWDSEFRGDADFSFGDQEEMGLGVRLATPLTVKAGGQILTSEGHKNEKEARGKASPWCDYSGTIDGKRAGVTLMQHPKNFRPAWFHARDYGLLVANPFGRKALTGGDASRVTVKQGETLRLRYGVLLHAGDAAKLDVAGAYKTYLQASADK
jgi:hypothetical protein